MRRGTVKPIIVSERDLKSLLAKEASALEEKEKFALLKMMEKIVNEDMRLILRGNGEDGWDALLFASKNGHFQVVEKLLVHPGFDPNAKDKYGKNCMHYASESGHVDVVDLLLRQFDAASCEARDRDGRNVVHYAAANGHREVVELLLNRGIDPKVQSIVDGRNPLHLAAANGHLDVMALLYERGVDPKVVTKNGWNALHWALLEEGDVGVVRWLLSVGMMDPNCLDNNRRNSLHLAVHQCPCEVVVLLLDRGAKVNTIDKDGMNTLHHAAIAGRADIVTLLLEHEVQPNLRDRDIRNAVHHAAESGFDDVIAVLLEHHDDPKVQDKDGKNALHLACAQGHIDSVTLLLEHGVDACVVCKDGNNSLHWAVSSGCDEAVLAVLDAGVDPLIENKRRFNALHLAASKGHKEVVAVLLDHGVNANVRNKDGTNAIQLASEHGHADVVALLLERKAKVYSQNNNKKNALHLAAINNHKSLITLLLRHGMDPEVQDEDGRNALHLAAREGYVDIVEMLLEYGIEPNTVDKIKKSALHLAAANGHHQLVPLLVMYGADVAATEKNGMSALHLAAERGHMNAVTALLAHNADPDQLSDDGATALHFASLNKHVELLLLLLLHGANPSIADKEGNSASSVGNTITRRIFNDLPFSLWETLITENYLEVALCFMEHTREERLQLIFQHLHDDAARRGHKAPFSLVTKKGSETFLHFLASKGASSTAIALVLKAYPAAANSINRKGKLPVELLLVHNQYSLQSVNDLLEAATSSALMTVTQMVRKLNSPTLTLLVAAHKKDEAALGCMYVHLCAHGCAGKTTLRTAICHAAPTEMNRSTSQRDLVEKIALENRTVGMEQEFIMLDGKKLILHDYGGQEEYHVNHPRFLAMPGSSYICIVPLFDVEANEPYAQEVILQRYQYWLRFINSVAAWRGQKDRAVVLTLVNFEHMVPVALVQEVVRGIQAVQKEWASYDDTSIKLHEGVMKVEAREIGDVQAIVVKELLPPILQECSLHVDRTELLKIVLQSKDLQKWPAVEKRDVLSVRIKECILRLSRGVSAEAVDPLLFLLVEAKIIKQLVAMGELTVVDDGSAHGGWAVHDLDWLTKRLLGKLMLKFKNHQSLKRNMMSAVELNEVTGDLREQFDGNPEGVAKLLEMVGLCIADRDPKQKQKQYFVTLFADKAPAGKCSVMNIRELDSGRCIVRRFQLTDPKTNVFPPGYFSKLFVDIAASEGLREETEVYEKAMVIRWKADGSKFQVIVKVCGSADAEQTEFELSVCTTSKGKALPGVTTAAWELFSRVRRRIRVNDNEEPSSWTQNVPLQELFIYPDSYISVDERVRDVYTEDKLYKRLKPNKPQEVKACLGWLHGVDEAALPVDEQFASAADIIEAQLKNAELREVKAALERISPEFRNSFSAMLGELTSLSLELEVQVRCVAVGMVMQNSADVQEAKRAADAVSAAELRLQRLHDSVDKMKCAGLNAQVFDGLRAAMKEFVNEITTLVKIEEWNAHLSALAQLVRSPLPVVIASNHDEELCLKAELKRRITKLIQYIQSSTRHVATLCAEIERMRFEVARHAKELRVVAERIRCQPVLFLLLQSNKLVTSSISPKRFSSISDDVDMKLLTFCPVTGLRGSESDLSLTRSLLKEIASAIQYSLILMKVAVFCTGMLPEGIALDALLEHLNGADLSRLLPPDLDSECHPALLLSVEPATIQHLSAEAIERGYAALSGDVGFADDMLYWVSPLANKHSRLDLSGLWMHVTQVHRIYGESGGGSGGSGETGAEIIAIEWLKLSVENKLQALVHVEVRWPSEIVTATSKILDAVYDVRQEMHLFEERLSERLYENHKHVEDTLDTIRHATSAEGLRAMLAVIVRDDKNTALLSEVSELTRIMNRKFAQLPDIKKLMERKMTEVMCKLETVQKEVTLSRESISVMYEELLTHTNMLHTLLEENNTHLPQLFMLHRADSYTVLDTLKSPFVKKMRLYFICPISRQPGDSYYFDMPREWLIKAAPALKLSLLLIKVALLCFGLPMPIPSLPDDLFANVYVDNYLKTLGEEVSASAADAWEEQLSEANGFLQPSEILAAIRPSEVKAGYDEILKLLREKEGAGEASAANGWEPKATGLVKVLSHKDKTTAWIHPSMEARFHEEGSKAIVVKFKS